MTKVYQRILLSALFFPLFSFAQDSTKVPVPAPAPAPALTFSGYADAYFAYYTDSVGLGNYQKFPSISPRSNSFGLNIGMVTAKYATDNLHSTVCVHYGDIPQSAWPTNYNNIIQEANAGIRLCKKVWLDAGFFRTHFGTEGLLPKENIASSVSICTFYEPYFEAGIKLNYAPNDKWAINFLVLNGYNIYQDNNDKKSVGMLVTYTPNLKVNFGYSNYIGDDSPIGDSVSHLRIHQNLFVNYEVKKFKFQVGGDFGMQQNSMIKDSVGTASMFAAVASVKYQCKSKFGVYARYEMFNDPDGFMAGIITNTDTVLTGYKLWGATFGLEYKPTANAYIRLEARQLQMDAKQEIFWWNSDPEDSRMEMMIHMGISF